MNQVKKPKEAVKSSEGFSFAKSYHIGYGQRRKTLEDRCEAKVLKTAAGEEVILGMVADGIGGANAGEVAGTMTLETIVDFIQGSSSTDYASMLQMALQEAHRQVRKMKTPEMRSMGTTCTAALIHQNTLFLAHVGDSRAYLIREGRAIQLTLDHTWANDKLRKGTFSEEEVRKNDKAGDLMRYIGMPAAQVDMDNGVHLEEPVSPKADPQHVGGLRLQPGDVVLLCTDGLIKERHNRPGQFYTTSAELVEVVAKNSAVAAADTLVSMALGRQVDDNVSVVILEAPGQKKAFAGAAPTLNAPIPGLNQKWLLGGGVLAALALVIIAVLALLGSQPPSTAPALVTSTSVVIQSTPIPTKDLSTLPQLAGVELKSGQVQQQALDLADGLPAVGQDIALLDFDLGAERPQTLQMQVYRPRPYDASAGKRDFGALLLCK